MKKTVHVIGNETGYTSMFLNNGWEVFGSPAEADFIQFTGGADVTPDLYGEGKHPTTYNNLARDENEAGIFDFAVDNNKNMLGICRGGQFLNVMSGGKLWQNVNNHAIGGTHILTDLATKKEVDVSSTHHQMMKVGNKGTLVASADGLATLKESDTRSIHNSPIDAEVVWYEDTKALCFQPHPEYFNKEHPCQAYYFELIDRMFGE